MGFNKKIRSFLAVASLAVASALPTQANAVTNALYLTMDGSGSIPSADWTLQVNGYINALNTVLGGGAYYGNTAIGVSKFSSGVTEIFAIQEINSAADLASLTAALTGQTQPSGLTAVGSAIDHAAAAIQGSFANATNKVIDVSTDGHSNTGTSPFTASANASAAGITTNCIGVGNNADCSFASGFSVLVNNFADFEAALVRKLERELGAPEPAVALLLAIGLVGMGVARRRRV